MSSEVGNASVMHSGVLGKKKPTWNFFQVGDFIADLIGSGGWI